MQSFRQKYIGTRAFYRMVLAIVIPIMIQNAITNFVSLLDNIMVGQVGTESMSGVAIANQLIFVFNLCVFGALSGAGIFSAQFYGADNQEGVRGCFRYGPGAFRAAVGMVRAGRVDLARMVTGRFPLEQTGLALHTALTDRDHLKIAVLSEEDA